MPLVNICFVFLISVDNTRRQIAFTAYHTLAETLGQHQAVRYNDVVTNTGNAYDPRDGHFTVPVAGLYSFSLTGMAYRTTTMILNIMKNNKFLAQIYSTVDLADSASVTIHTHLNMGDHVWVENGGGAGARLHDGQFNTFSGILDKTD